MIIRSMNFVCTFFVSFFRCATKSPVPVPVLDVYISSKYRDNFNFLLF